VLRRDEVLQLAHGEQAFGEGVGAAHEFSDRETGRQDNIGRVATAGFPKRYFSSLLAGC
jgi:hypothetical protein